ncbi:MAG: NHLP bacteriocin export ABC transporter permease/ATPase subunit [Planctomycetia bacterium TMED53]|nr:MAG: NHLP bacteriocin export ABC transporter permease/ATPase subunit [Planctomycetia bacterium TMED53]
MSRRFESLESHGKIHHASGHQSLLLRDRDKFWLVIEGHGELVATDVIDDQSSGRRKPLGEIQLGDSLFSISHHAATSEYCCMVSSHDSMQILELPLDKLDLVAAALQQSIADVVGSWASKLSPLLQAGGAPANSDRLQSDTSASISPGHMVTTPHQESCWIHISTGAGLLSGEMALSSEDSPLLLPRGCWIEATEELAFEIADPAAIDQNPALDALQQLNDLIQKRRDATRSEEGERNLQRVKRRETIEEKGSQHALATLASVLNPQVALQNPGEDLYSVMKTVGNAKGIPILPMAESTDLEKLSDPAEAITRASRIQYRKVVFRGDWWKRDVGPLVGYLQEDDRPVAILLDNKGRYHIHDPRDDSKTLINGSTQQRLKRHALVLIRTLGEDKNKPVDLVAFSLKNKFPDITAFATAAVVLTVMGMLFPQAMAIILDSAIPNSNSRLLLELGGALLAVTLGMTLLSIFQSFVSLRLSVNTDFESQSAIWDRVLRLKTSFFSNYSTGDLLQRISAAHAISQEFSGPTMLTLLTSLMALLNVILLFIYNAKLALVAIAIATIVAIVTFLGGVLIRRHARKLMEEEGELFGFEVQLISAVSKLRVAGAERRAFALWMNRIAKQLHLSNRVQVIVDNLALFNRTIPMLSTLALFMLAMPLITEPAAGAPALSIGIFLAFNTALGVFLGGALTLSSTIVDFLDTTVLAERMKPLLEAEMETTSASIDPGKIKGEIELSRIHFRYSADGPKILEDVSIHAKPGEMIALTGTSGCGKSTLLRLMLGFETPESGEIRFDGQNIDSVDSTAVRRQLGVVLQSGHISAGTIFENITVGSVYTMEEAWEAVEEAGIADDIYDMPMQLHTVVSEGGSNLSGGQRQRLLIARALIRRPKVLFLDEATSALDNKAQNIVNESLNRRNVTRVVIAHRLSSIREANCIYVLDKGRVVEKGTYAELAAADGVFAGLLARQST